MRNKLDIIFVKRYYFIEYAHYMFHPFSAIFRYVKIYNIKRILFTCEYKYNYKSRWIHLAHKSYNKNIINKLCVACVKICYTLCYSTLNYGILCNILFTPI
jgi:hypothetical protein